MLLVSANVHADHIPDLTVYETRFTAKSGHRFNTDPNDWVYTSEFARQFNLPPRWADDDIRGVDALASRVKWATGRRCGFEDAPHCRVRLQCLVEIFVPRDERLPVHNDLEVNLDMFSRDYSMRYLMPQSEADKQARADLRRSVQLAGAAAYAYRDDDEQAHLSPIYMTRYERRVRGQDMLTLGLNCDWIKQARAHPESFRILLGQKGVSQEEIETAYQNRDETTAIFWRSIFVPQAALERWKEQKEQLNWEPAYYDVHADQPWLGGPAIDAPNYAAQYTNATTGEPIPELDGQWDEDMNVWGYTREFAERFGMPEQWIEDDMGDALALAFRVERTMDKTCGLGFNPKNCIRNEICMVDVYLPDDASLPWYKKWPVARRVTDEDSASLYTRTVDKKLAEQGSRVSLLSQYIYGGGFEDKPITYPATIIGGQLQSRDRMTVSGINLWWKPWKWTGGPATGGVYRYDRRYPGMQVLTMTTHCTTRGSWNRVKKGDTFQHRDLRWIFFPRPKDLPESYAEMKDHRVEKPDILVEVKRSNELDDRWSEHQTSVHRLSKRFEKQAKELVKKQTQQSNKQVN